MNLMMRLVRKVFTSSKAMLVLYARLLPGFFVARVQTAKEFPIKEQKAL